MNKLIVILLVWARLLVGCQKGGMAYVEGNIYEEGSNKPIGNVDIILIKSHDENQG